jgi:hypothetical protein
MQTRETAQHGRAIASIRAEFSALRTRYERQEQELVSHFRFFRLCG